jgi:hypothetical protein
MTARKLCEEKFSRSMEEVEELCRAAVEAGVDQRYLTTVIDGATQALEENWFPETDGEDAFWIPLKIAKDTAAEIRQLIFEAQNHR